MQAERILRQLTDIQRTHGELRGTIIHESPESLWCPAPIEATKPAYHEWHESRTGIIWTESSEYTNAFADFSRLCPEMIDISSCSNELQEWNLSGSVDVAPVLRWLWLAAGFSLATLPGQTPRSARKCWGRNGHYFNAATLEHQRKHLPVSITADMPPNADNWLVKIENLIQVSIEAVEYFAANSDELVTIKQVAERCVDVDSKTLLNNDSKNWGPHVRKIGRDRAWYWHKILPILLKTRRLKDT